MSKRTVTVTYRATPEHVETVKRLASICGMSQSDLHHKLVEKEDKSRAKALRKLQRLGQEIESKD